MTTVATSPYVRLRAVLARQTEYDQSFYASFEQQGSTPRTVIIEATAAFIGAGAFDVTIPDLTAAGYDATFGLKTGVSTLHVLQATGYSTAINSFAQLTPGTTVRTAAKAGQFTP